MPTLELSGIRKAFGPTTALEHLDLALHDGEFVSLLGPSGCGKTTALRVVAGFDAADEGSVLLDGADISRRPPNRRDMGMVFQSYSLFPHLNALDNVAFGLRMRRQGAGPRRKRAGEILELVGLSAEAQRFPHQLSGGQQQRVALARALAINPKVLLLDEPLSALDAKVRVSLRDEIRRIQRELGITTLFVTHDQEEAMAVSDRVGVMSQGRLEQLDSPLSIYHRPATPFVARFVGTVSTLDGVVRDGGVEVADRVLPVAAVNGRGAGVRVRLLVRPEAVVLGPEADGVPGLVVSQSFRGSVTRVIVALDGGGEMIADLSSSAAAAAPAGGRVGVSVGSEGVFVEDVEAGAS